MLYNKYFILSCNKHVRIKFGHLEKSATLHEIKGAFHSAKNSELLKRVWMGRKFPWKVSEKCELGRRKSESICIWFVKCSQSVIETSDIYTRNLDQEECYRSHLSAICLCFCCATGSYLEWVIFSPLHLGCQTRRDDSEPAVWTGRHSSGVWDV